MSLLRIIDYFVLDLSLTILLSDVLLLFFVAHILEFFVCFDQRFELGVDINLDRIANGLCALHTNSRLQLIESSGRSCWFSSKEVSIERRLTLLCARLGRKSARTKMHGPG